MPYMRLQTKFIYTLITAVVIAFSGMKLTSAQGSNLTAAYDKLFLIVTIVSFFVLAFVMVLFILFINKYRETNEATERKPIPHATARKLELIWHLVAIFIIIGLMVVSYPFLFELDDLTTDQDPNATIVIIEGTAGWEWVFHIPSENVTNRAVTDSEGVKTTTMFLKTDVKYQFIFWSSGPWIHSFYSPGLNFKMDVVPGSNNTISITILDPGTYEVLCTEYCGTGHSFMRGKIEVTA